MKEYKMGLFGLLVEKVHDEGERVTPSGIIIPGTINRTMIKGKVIATGEGSQSKKMEVKTGEVVTYNSVTAIEIELENKRYNVVDARQCLFIN